MRSLLPLFYHSGFIVILCHLLILSMVFHIKTYFGVILSTQKGKFFVCIKINPLMDGFFCF